MLRPSSTYFFQRGDSSLGHSSKGCGRLHLQRCPQAPRLVSSRAARIASRGGDAKAFRRLSPEQLEQLIGHAQGESPDGLAVEFVARQVEGLAENLAFEGPSIVGIEEKRQRNPVHGLNLVIEGELWVADELVEVGDDDHGQPFAVSDGVEVREFGEGFGGGTEIEADLFAGLAQSGVAGVDVPVVFSSSWEGHVSRPGIPRVFCSVNEEQLRAALRVLTDDGGDRRALNSRNLCDEDWAVTLEAMPQL